MSQEVGDNFTLKMGIAHAYKAPNLFQTNKNYLLYSQGQGCVGSDIVNVCYLIGNDNLKAKTSVNKEFGLDLHNAGWHNLLPQRLSRKNRSGQGQDPPPAAPVQQFISGKTCRKR